MEMYERFKLLVNKEPVKLEIDVDEEIPYEIREKLHEYFHLKETELLTITGHSFHLCVNNWDSDTVEGGMVYYHNGQKLNKRILKYLKNKLINPTLEYLHKEQLTNSMMEEIFPSEVIGTMIYKDKINIKNEVYYDIVSDIDWDAGDFGDGDSCFWQSRSNCREALNEDPNCYAFRTYKMHHVNIVDKVTRETLRTEDKLKGLSRCWLKYFSDKDLIVIFNGYGLTLEVSAGLLESILEVKSKEIDLNTNDSSMWINDNSGIIFSEKEYSRTSLDLGVYTEPQHECCECGDSISEDDMYTNDNGDKYCSSCYHEHFATCYHCGSEIYREDSLMGSDEEDYCEHCFNKYFFTCNDCGEVFEQDEMKEDHYGYSVCEDCFNDSSFECEKCGDIKSKRDLIEFDGKNYCDDCYEENTFECSSCGEIFKIEDQETINDKDFCQYCYRTELDKEKENV